jgi:hypothetical protein
MTPAFLFWLFYILAFAFHGVYAFRSEGGRATLGGSLFWFILLGLLGWKVFGSPVAG